MGQIKGGLIHIIFLILTQRSVMSTEVMNLLSNSLNPSLLDSTQKDIERTRGNEGFATQLMVVADNASVQLAMRQSALVILKNLVADDCARGGVMHSGDLQIIKANILQFLIRIWGERKLTGTLREIIHLLAVKYYPEQWPEIMPAILNNITNPSQFNTVASSVEALKALASVYGGSPAHEVTLNNLCNLIFVPLFNLANKLFSNYTVQTQNILISIFKIFNLTIFYHMPVIIMNNVHEIMIFCKKILEINSKELEPLKVVALKILGRIYSRHATSKVSYKLMKFAIDFHNRYSLFMIETFIMLLMNPHSNLEILNLSLKCLTCIYRDYDQGADVLNKNRQKLVNLCIQRYSLSKEMRKSQSIGSFITCLKEDRMQVIEFFEALFSCDEGILSDFIENLNSGNEKIQQFVLYAFAALGQEIEQCPHLYENMCSFMSSYILPILSGDTSAILKARGCQIVSNYNYLNLNMQTLEEIFKFIYPCLTTNKEEFLNIYALEAFTHLIIKYDDFMKVIIPYLSDILQVYIAMMKQSHGEVHEVIKSFESFLGNLSAQHLEPYAVSLVEFLVGLFYEYARERHRPASNVQGQEEESGSEEEEDENNYNACTGCLACIRQILTCENFPQHLLPVLEQKTLLPLIAALLQDKALPHFEQCLNILNLLLFQAQQQQSSSTSPSPLYCQLFEMCIYSIVGIPQQLASVNISEQLKEILVNVCVEPDQDIVANVIGVLRNFVARFQIKIKEGQDKIGVSYLEYLFKVVDCVHNSKNENGYKYKESDRWIIMTLYSSLLEYQVLNAAELSHLLQNAVNWYQESRESTRSNILLQILIISLYYHPKETTSELNVNWFIGELLCKWNTFLYQYELQRVIIGVAKVMEDQILTDIGLAKDLISRLPDLVARFLRARHEEENGKADLNGNEGVIDAEEEAEEDLVAENTHLGLRDEMSAGEKMREQKLKEIDENEWEQEYNKFYFSPFSAIQELAYLKNILGNNQYYRDLLSPNDQALLGGYLQ